MAQLNSIGIARHLLETEGISPRPRRELPVSYDVRDSIRPFVENGSIGRIPPDQERAALQATVKIGHAGKRLASALRTMDRAQSAIEKAAAGGEVSALLDTINGLIFDALAPFTDSTVRAQVAGLLKEVNALLLTIAGAIARAA